LLAWMERGPLVKIHEQLSEDIAANGMGHNWSEFRAYLTEIRRRGFYRSIGELQPGVGAVAVPVFNADEDCVGALAIVGSASRIKEEPDTKLLKWLNVATSDIQTRLRDS